MSTGHGTKPGKPINDETRTYESPRLVPHLFRTEFRKIVSVLGKFFGAGRIEVAEDIASETFLHALETWAYKGIPENPSGWLYTVAKNKAINYVKRSRYFDEKIKPEMPVTEVSDNIDIDLSTRNISDSQLQMLFAVCHPSIPAESQIALSLRLLCGFGIEEIANAFLTTKETINKRLYRAKDKLREENITVELPEADQISTRLEAVLRTLYLMFSEGYYSESKDNILREDLCIEAMRLSYLLLENPTTAKPEVNALLALMCFHSSRFAARKNDHGEIILYNDQDENLWDQQLISKGAHYLHQASQGKCFTKYHLEAAIAYWHTVKTDSNEKWENILQLYNRLLILEYSPMAALNRTFALSKTAGNKEAIREAKKLDLEGNPYYHMLLGELYKHEGDNAASAQFAKALALARTNPEKQIIQKRIHDL